MRLLIFIFSLLILGRGGQSLSIITERDINLLTNIESKIS